MGIFIPQLKVGFGDHYFTISDDPSDIFSDALDDLKDLYSKAIELGFKVNEILIEEYYHGDKSKVEKYIGADLSNIPYNERKDICDNYVYMIDYFIENDFTLFGTMQTLYDGRTCMRDKIDENYSCYNVGDKVITSNDGHAIITYSPGLAYSNIYWSNEYKVMCEDGEERYYYGHLLTKEMNKNVFSKCNSCI